jgi:hypothetical protein
MVCKRLAVRVELGSVASVAGVGDPSAMGSAGTSRSGEVSVGSDILVGTAATGRQQEDNY